MTWIRLPAGEWLPDSETSVLPSVETGGISLLTAGMPTEYGYRNWKRLTETGTAADQKLTGAGNGVQTDGTYQMFAGGATKLFRYSSGWTDASRTVGGAYTGSTNNWTFAQFGTLMIACNGVDAPQKFTIGGTGNFEALGGSPPVAKYVTVVRDFVIMANISGATNRVQWSAINDAEDYAASATTQSDSQDIPDEGPVLGIVGGEYGLIFFANAVYRMTYVGSPVIFQFDKIGDIGLIFPMSPAGRGEDVFYVSREGLAVVRSGQACQNIGTGKISRKFLESVGTAFSNPARNFGAVDPQNSLYMLALCNGSGAETDCNELFCYHWPTGRWGLGKLEGLAPNAELIFQTTVSGVVTVAGIGDAHKFATFSGISEPMSAYSHIFEPIPGKRFFIRGVQPVVSQITHTAIQGRVIVYPRQPLESEATNSGQISVDSTGTAPARACGRYLRVAAHVNSNAAANSQDWVLQGWNIDVIPEGGR